MIGCLDPLGKLYPTPTDPEEFDRRYEREHLPMGKASLIGATGLASRSRVARRQVSVEAIQECAATPGAQKTLANAVAISTGGAPHFMIVEEEG